MAQNSGENRELGQNERETVPRRLVPTTGVFLHNEAPRVIEAHDQNREQQGLCLIFVVSPDNRYDVTSFEGQWRESKDQVVASAVNVTSVLYTHGSRYIGKGSYGKVYRARAILPDAKVEVDICIKQCDPSSLEEANALANEQRMYDRIRNISHPNLLYFYGLFAEVTSCYMLLEYFPGQDLDKYVSTLTRSLSPSVVIDIMIKLMDALKCLHAIKIGHFDLKPQNILYSEQHRTLKLIDFGLSCDLTYYKDCMKEGYRIGTIPYMAPEILLQKEASRKCDIYAAGATALHVITRKRPWHWIDGPNMSKEQMVEQIKRQIEANRLRDLLYMLPEDDEWRQVVGVVQGMLSYESSPRPEAISILIELQSLQEHDQMITSESGIQLPTSTATLFDSSICNGLQGSGSNGQIGDDPC